MYNRAIPVPDAGDPFVQGLIGDEKKAATQGKTLKDKLLQDLGNLKGDDGWKSMIADKISTYDAQIQEASQHASMDGTLKNLQDERRKAIEQLGPNVRIDDYAYGGVDPSKIHVFNSVTGKMESEDGGIEKAKPSYPWQKGETDAFLQGLFGPKGSTPQPATPIMKPLPGLAPNNASYDEQVQTIVRDGMADSRQKSPRLNPDAAGRAQAMPLKQLKNSVEKELQSRFDSGKHDEIVGWLDKGGNDFKALGIDADAWRSKATREKTRQTLIRDVAPYINTGNTEEAQKYAAGKRQELINAGIDPDQIVRQAQEVDAKAQDVNGSLDWAASKGSDNADGYVSSYVKSKTPGQQSGWFVISKVANPAASIPWSTSYVYSLTFIRADGSISATEVYGSENHAKFIANKYRQTMQKGEKLKNLEFDQDTLGEYISTIKPQDARNEAINYGYAGAYRTHKFMTGGINDLMSLAKSLWSNLLIDATTRISGIVQGDPKKMLGHEYVPNAGWREFSRVWGAETGSKPLYDTLNESGFLGQVGNGLIDMGGDPLWALGGASAIKGLINARRALGLTGEALQSYEYSKAVERALARNSLEPEGIGAARKGFYDDAFSEGLGLENSQGNVWKNSTYINKAEQAGITNDSTLKLIDDNMDAALKNGSKYTEPTLKEPGIPKGNFMSQKYINQKKSGNVSIIDDKNLIPEERGWERQDEAAIQLTNAKYDTTMLPERMGGNTYGKKTGTNPDFLINGKAFDCYSPSTSDIDNIYQRVARKANDQASGVVLNLKDYTGSIDDLVKYFYDNPIPSMDEMFIIKNNQIARVFLR